MYFILILMQNVLLYSYSFFTYLILDLFISLILYFNCISVISIQLSVCLAFHCIYLLYLFHLYILFILSLYLFLYPVSIHPVGAVRLLSARGAALPRPQWFSRSLVSSGFKHRHPHDAQREAQLEVSPCRSQLGAMARGHQKIQSQQKNAKKAAEKKKGQAADQKSAAMAALIHTCPVCRSQMPDPKTFKQHFESKHPKSPMPPELVDVQA